MGSYRRAFHTTTRQVPTMKTLLLVCVVAALSTAVPLPNEDHHGHHGHHGSLAKLASKLHHKNEEHHNLASKLQLASKLHHKNERHHEEEDHHEDEHHHEMSITTKAVKYCHIF